MATPKERGEFYAEKARKYLDEGCSREEAHIKANQETCNEFSVSRRTIRKNTKPYREGKKAYPDQSDNSGQSEKEKTGNADRWIKDGEYHFDESTGEYLVYLDAADQMITIPKEKMGKIWEWYSDWTGDKNTINQICQKLGFPRTWFNELRRKLGMTHDREPFTPEEVVDNDTDQLIDDLLQKRRRELAESWENEKLEQVKEEAEQFRMIRQGQIEPLKRALSSVDLTMDDAGSAVEIALNGSCDEDYAALIGIADCHIGYDDYDAESWSVRDSGDRVLEAYKNLLERTFHHGEPDRIILAFLGDFFHVDREDLSTSYGTQVEAAGLIEEILKEGYRVAHRMIEMAREVCDVSIRVVEGNHDRVTSKGMMIHVDDKFQDCDTDLNFNERQYLQYKNNLIGLWHGDTIRDRDIPNVMADEASELWGKTSNRYVVFGHIHPELVNDEHRGVTMLRLASPSGREEYDYRNGYDPTNALTSIRLHPDEGRIGMDYGS